SSYFLPRVLKQILSILNLNLESLMQFKNRTYILPSLFSSNASSKGVRRTPFLPFSNNLDSKRKCPCVIFPFIFGSTTTIPIWLISLPQYHSITLLYHFLPLNNIIS